MPKGRRSSFVIRVNGAFIEEIEKRPVFCDMTRTEITNHAFRKLINEGQESNRMRSWSVSVVNAVARACGARDVIVTLGASVDDDGRVTHSLGAMIDGKMVHDLPVFED